MTLPPSPTNVPSPRTILGIALLILGLLGWFFLGHAALGRNYQVIALLIIIGIAAIPPLPHYFSLALNSIRSWTFRHRNLTALLIAVAAIPFLYSVAIFEHRPLIPYWEDEFVYLIQAHMMAHGRLWMHPHPLARFFGSIYLATDHAYTSIYFPGTAIMLTPTIWLELPKHIGPLIIAGITVGLIFRIVTELFDGVMGILAAFMLISLPIFQRDATMVLSQGPMLMLGLLMVLAYLRWRNIARSTPWLIILSVTMGLAAITRPIDAFCYAAIIAIAIICDLRRQKFAVWTKTASILLPIVLAFLSIQLIFNIGATGHWNTTPYGDYLHRQFPGIDLEFSAPPDDVHPQSDLPQIRQLYVNFVRRVMGAHQASKLLPVFFQQRLPMLWNLGFPDPFFWIIIPLSFLALFKNRAWILWAVLPLALLVYTSWAFIPHYLIPFLPAIIVFQLLAIPGGISTFPRHAHQIQCALVLGIVALCVLSLPQIDPSFGDPNYTPLEIEQIQDALNNIRPPAIVLFHYHNGDLVNGQRVVNSAEIEPVYNPDVAWPDDAPIIRAHDRNTETSALGTPTDQNHLLYQYYANINPHRTVYLYDRLSPTFPGQLKPLGSVGDLVRKTSSK